MKSVDIIITNYNGEEYLSTILDSIADQTYIYINVIIVDDCSNDSSKEIIEKYLKEHPSWIVIYNSDNEGISFSRNVGLDNSFGEYVYFADNDDYLAPNTIERLIDLATEHEADVVDEESIFVYKRKGKVYYFTERPIPPVAKVLTKEEIIFYPRYSRGKLYKREVIGQTRFDQSVRCYEDILFEFTIKNKINKYVYAPDSGYYYLQRKNSLVTTVTTRHTDIVYVSQRIIGECSKNDYFGLDIKKQVQNATAITALSILASKYPLMKISSSKKRKLRKEFRQMMKRTFDFSLLKWWVKLAFYLLTGPFSPLAMFFVKLINTHKLNLLRLSKANPYKGTIYERKS